MSWSTARKTNNDGDLAVNQLMSLKTRSTGKPLSYVDIFADNFVGLSQEYSNIRQVQKILYHAINEIFRPLNSTGNPFHRQPTSFKNLDKGDCSWGTIKLILGWIIDSVSTIIHLPHHRLERLAEI